MGDADDPIRQIAKLHKQKLLDYTLELTKDLGVKDPIVLAKQFFVLIEGTITVARVMGDFTALDSAKEIANILLKEVPRTSA
ncbi:putative transcriptional regulator [compost metagenome]